MVRTIKLMLKPNNRQKTKLFQYANGARYAFNWTLEKVKENDKKGKEALSLTELEEAFRQQIRMETYQWMEKIPMEILRESMKDARNAYKNFLSGVSQCPKFKRRNKSQAAFRESKAIQITSTHVKIEGLSESEKRNRQGFNWIRLSRHYHAPVNGEYHCLKISYEGKHWYASLSVIEPEEKERLPAIKKQEGGKERNEKTQERQKQPQGNEKDIQTVEIIKDRMEKLKKRKRRLERSIRRKQENNREGESYRKTKNMIKREKELLNINRRLSNYRMIVSYEERYYRESLR